MSNKPYAVVFRLTGGHTVQVNVPEDQAKGYLNSWLTKTMGPAVGELDTTGPWGIKSSEIVAIQLFDAEEIARLSQQSQGTRPQQPLLGPYYKSGPN